MLFGKHLNRYYLRYLPRLLLGAIALIVVDYAQLLIPNMYQLVINGLNYGVVQVNGTPTVFDMPFLLDSICLPLLFIILAMMAGRFAWRICFLGAGACVETDLRSKMFDHCKDLSQQFYQTNKVGNLMSLFTNDLETVQDCFGSGVMMLCDALFLGLLAIFKMWNMSPFLTFLSLIPMVILVCVSTVVGHYMTSKWEKRQEAFSALSDFAQESFSGIAVIKAFVRETLELMAFRRLNRENEDANVIYTKASVLLHVFVSLFVESVVCIILGYGGFLVYSKALNAGQLVEYIGYFTALIWPVMSISEMIEMHSRGRASLNRIEELLEAKPDVVDRAEVQDVDVLRGDIAFRHLTFRYPGGEFDVLRDISFHIKAGESVGIIGRTGSGKSTLVDLVLRTYNVPDGTILLDGRDINSISIHTVRDNAAYVPQDSYLFSDTIEHNIAFAMDSDDHESVEKAAHISDVHDNIISFSQGYQTILGERGVTVSGGQKQRISIARALIKKAPILFLDDSVSAVDVSTEKIILDNLRSERKGMTTVLIAHRISTIEHMDRILLLDDGLLLAEGTHEELYASCPTYHDMVEAQRLDDEKKAEESEGNQHE